MNQTLFELFSTIRCIALHMGESEIAERAFVMISQIQAREILEHVDFKGASVN